MNDPSTAEARERLNALISRVEETESLLDTVEVADHARS